MKFADSLMARCAEETDDRNVFKVDFGSIAENLLLFDRFILKSIRLKEFPAMIQAFGFDAVMELLRSRFFEIEYNVVTIGQTGQATVLQERERKGALPQGSYSFSLLKPADRKELVSGRLRSYEEIPGLSFKQVKALKRAVALKVVDIPPDFGRRSVSQLNSDLVNNSPLIRMFILDRLREELDVSSSDLEGVHIRIEALDETDFRTEHNLSGFGLDEVRVHKLVEKSLLGLGGLNQRLEEMRVFSAVSGFTARETPLFEQKFDFLASELSPERQVGRLSRVVEIAGLPDLSTIGDKAAVDLHKLLEIRESAECVEFRNWLRTTDTMSEEDIRDRVTNVGSKLSSALRSPIGRTLRFLFTAGISILPGGAIASPLAGAIDTFLIEKVLPNSGLATFVNRLYPSIFKHVADET